MKSLSAFAAIKRDLNAVLLHDPATKSKLEAALCSSGLHALILYRLFHFFHVHRYFVTARILSALTRLLTGIEIHPGAVIGSGVFIDHGTGVVIGETAVVGDNVVIYQGVTLGGTGKDEGKRHPTVQDDVMISAGAKVLGPFTVGRGAKIGAGAVVLREVPPNATVVGVPARIVKLDGQRVDEQDDGDTTALVSRIDALENKITQIQAELNRNNGE
ncbi:MAG: serine O-acetyltransferase [Clostridiales bacterium]|nr:serine O-acetyltransferase [Clostridiales bacterium]